MKGDFSRATFDAAMHYSAVLDQQGRPRLDAELNEYTEIVGHRVETEAIDVIGAYGVPEHDAGFGITTDGKSLTIGAGRLYVDGIMCENEAAVAYGAQPDLPVPVDPLTLLNGGAGVVALDVWRRHKTALDDARIREVALNGADSTTRVQTLWQVRVLPVATVNGAAPDCGATYPEWDALIAPPTGTLNARTNPATVVDDPCLLPPGAGYQRLDNRLYRIEIHDPGKLGVATYKMSRDNGSVVTAIEQVSGLDLTVHDVGPDDDRGFKTGDWVELLDDRNDLNGTPGALLQIANVDPATRTVSLGAAPPALSVTLHAKMRRWDSAGALPVNIPGTNGGWSPVEGGVEILFSDGTYDTGDYWLIPARTATAEIEWPPFAVPNTAPIAQPRAGIQHHYCRLAVVQVVSGQLTIVADCRPKFPPLIEVNGGGSAPPATVQVVATNWNNDDDFGVDQLVKGGLRFDLSAVPWPATALTQNPFPAAIRVTIDLPLTDQANSGLLAFGNGALMSLELAGNATIAGQSIRWIPTKEAQAALGKLVAKERTFRVRVSLSGHVTWSGAEAPRLYLDGRARGLPGIRVDGSARTRLQFPSGVGDVGSDFESWFYLVRTVPPPPPLQVSNLAFFADKASVPVTFPGLVTLPPLPVQMQIFQNDFVTSVEIGFTRAILPASANPKSVMLELSVLQAADAAAKMRGARARGAAQAKGAKGKITKGGATWTPVPNAIVLATTNDRVRVTLTGVDGQGRAATFVPGTYRLTLGGAAASAGTAILGQSDNLPLDGDYDGTAGGNFVLTFDCMAPIG